MENRRAFRVSSALILAALFAAASAPADGRTVALQADSLPTIRRTEYGVPHIQATTFRGVGIGLGYTQVEDYGERVILSLLRGKGYMGMTFGRDSMASDFNSARRLRRVQETYHLLSASTRGVYEGFAEGINIFIRSHPDRVPPWARPIFTGHDAAALDIQFGNVNAARQLVMRQLRRDSAGGSASGERRTASYFPDDTFDPPPGPEDGSNAWALAPSRTRSRSAILLRNPHLAWNAGYWEAHVTIPGVLNFYGDFRIGSAFAVIGGFNEALGFSTTNNVTDPDEVYAFNVDPNNPNNYLFDGVSAPVRVDSTTVQFTTAAGIESETRAFEYTPLGPVAYRTPTHIYIVRSGVENEYRGGEQFLRMMLASSHTEYTDAMKLRARATSNFTYADRDGNIHYLWNGAAPLLPHTPGGDSLVFPASTSADIWTRLIPYDSLPQMLNPSGGYVHNENDAPYFANSRAVLDTSKYPPNIERPAFRLRSQHAAELLDGRQRYSLEEVVALKHSMKMLLADRVKPDLMRAGEAELRRNSQDTVLARALAVLREWDNTVAANSRGSLLFDSWWRRYNSQAGDSAYAEDWTPAKFNTTPRGLGRPDLVTEALRWAVDDVTRRYGAIDVEWGEIHRVRRGDVDAPVGGCSGALGCFRVLSFVQNPDGKRAVSSGDGWVLAVEFGRRGPRAYSVLAYGQSPDTNSPHHADQAEMFARGEMKTVRFTDADIAAHTIRTYRPGQLQLPPT